MNKIDDIKNMLKQSRYSNKDLLKEKMIACLCCDWGVARRTMVEYINIVVNAGYASESKNDDGEVVIKWVKD